MDFTNHRLNNNSNSDSDNSSNTIAIAIDDEKIDYLLDNYSAVYPQGYRGWHAKWIKGHGLELWERNARIAQQEGRDPQRYFVWLLKRSA